MIDIRSSQLGTCLNKIVFLYFSLFMEVKMLEELLHLFEETTVHENGANAAQKLIEVDILFATLV